MTNVMNLLVSMRPKQWIKNLFVFAGVLFSRHAFDVPFIGLVSVAFIVFCLLSGAVYLLNDLIDMPHDKMHPVKSQRPIAGGKLSRPVVLGAVSALTGISLGISVGLGVPFLLTALAYVVLQVAYSLYLKNQVILDVFSIAAGFVLRVVGGAVVIGVTVSPWLVICTLLLSLFLGLSKRRHEIATFDEAHTHRAVLKHYSTQLVDQMIAVVTASTVVCYALYTMAPETIIRFETHNLIYTVPFVLYGIFRYLFLIHKKGEGGNPETILVSDVPLLASTLLWVATAAFIIYR